MRPRLAFLLLAALLPACSHPHQPLSEYTAHGATLRQHLPQGYIAYLKQSRFTHHELDDLPPYAILFHGNPAPFFPSLGLSPDQITTLDLGTTDTSTLSIIRPRTGTPYLINRAQPGAGGTATQTAELAALGARYLVHIGTSGLLGPAPSRQARGLPSLGPPPLDEHTLALSTSSYKDGAATLLSEHPDDPLSRPNPELTNLLRHHLTQLHIPSAPAAGYTIPVYYFQPEGLITSLLTSKDFSSPRPSYLEMEESPFFESAAITHTAAASLTVGADRYALDAHGRLTHAFLDDAAVTRSLTDALRATIATFNDLAAQPRKARAETRNQNDESNPNAQMTE